MMDEHLRPDKPSVSPDDLEQHIVKFGVDLFPPLDVRDETTRANELFRELNTNWPTYFQELTFRPQSNEYGVWSTYEFPRGKARIPSLTFVPRGVVFTFPERLQPPLGDWRHQESYEELFLVALNQVTRVFPGRDVLRVGLIRELLFNVGQTPSGAYISSRFGEFPGAEPRGGEVLLTFQDDQCNIRVKITTVEIRRQAQLPATGQVMREELEFGLSVNFDVNNKEMRPQGPEQIRDTIIRAGSFWPKQLLEFLNWGATDAG